jgi:DNA-binding ferritin-like protein
MNTQTMTKPANTSAHEHSKIAHFLGEIFSFNSSLKLIHWNVSGRGSYAAHLSLDEAITTLLAVTDRLVETSYARFGELNIVIPETKKPHDYISHMEDFFDYLEKKRALFTDAFTQSILDDYQEGIEQLLYRLKRLQ